MEVKEIGSSVNQSWSNSMNMFKNLFTCRMFGMLRIFFRQKVYQMNRADSS
jgi:hypothetical protein